MDGNLLEAHDGQQQMRHFLHIDAVSMVWHDEDDREVSVLVWLDPQLCAHGFLQDDRDIVHEHLRGMPITEVEAAVQHGIPDAKPSRGW